jgi:hypothetical protein
MLTEADIFSQNSFEPTGFWGYNIESTSMFNSFEINPSNFLLIKDWGLSLSYGGEYSDQLKSNLYLISLSKKIDRHSLSVRYTPGYQKEFLFSTGETIIFNDSTSETLTSRLNYKELFGFGYSYMFNERFGAGFTMRYFNEDFNNEIVKPVFTDTSIYIVRENELEENNFWKTDIGFNYSPFNNLSIALSSLNLLNFGRTDLSSENEMFSLKQEKGAHLAVSYSPYDNSAFNFLYETTSSLQAGVNYYFSLPAGVLALSATLFHDRYQSPFIAGIVPAVAYAADLFGITLSGVKYFSNRGKVESFDSFGRDGISNIINNRYSFDKAVLSVSFTLNTIKTRSVELIDVEVIKDIFPTLSDLYLDFPFAKGRVLNLTDKPVSIRPYSRIEGVNTDIIQSPVVMSAGRDTVEVYFYTVIPDQFYKNKAEISYANFFVATSGDDPADYLQKAVLVNGSNAWNGKVADLRYFVKKDFTFSINYTRDILSNYKKELDTIPSALSRFYKSKIIFNEMVKELVYISDPRASAEYVQFPAETIGLKGGDCDDLSVLYISLLESSGIETALVDYRPPEGVRHVNMLVNTGLKPEQSVWITENDTKYLIRKNEKQEDEIWIAVETTSLTDFDTAWNQGAVKFNYEALHLYGLVKGTVDIIDVY